MSKYHRAENLTSSELVALNTILSDFIKDPKEWTTSHHARAALLRVWGKVSETLRRGKNLSLTSAEHEHLVKLGKGRLKEGYLDKSTEEGLRAALAKLGVKSATVALAA